MSNSKRLYGEPFKCIKRLSKGLVHRRINYITELYTFMN